MNYLPCVTSCCHRGSDFGLRAAFVACSGSLEGSDKILVDVLRDVKAFVTSGKREKISNIFLHQGQSFDPEGVDFETEYW